MELTVEDSKVNEKRKRYTQSPISSYRVLCSLDG